MSWCLTGETAITGAQGVVGLLARTHVELLIFNLLRDRGDPCRRELYTQHGRDMEYFNSGRVRNTFNISISLFYLQPI